MHCILYPMCTKVIDCYVVLIQNKMNLSTRFDFCWTFFVWLFFSCFVHLIRSIFGSLEIAWYFPGSFFSFFTSFSSALIKTDLFVFLVIVIKAKANANQVVDDLSSYFFKSMELIVKITFIHSKSNDRLKHEAKHIALSTEDHTQIPIQRQNNNM